MVNPKTEYSSDATRCIGRRAWLRDGTLTLALTAIAPSSRLSAKESTTLRIGLVTDLHYADKPPAGSRHYRESLAKLKEAGEVFRNNKIDLVVMEACGPSGWISDLCQELGLNTLVCSTNEEAWQWKNVKRKTDKDDALRLANVGRYRRMPLITD